ncbi:MAG: hypothetical protein JWM74_1953 [Myxococcaceae bacterium]|nr:hypothetical protein [Myxococcaceae bacterium]
MGIIKAIKSKLAGKKKAPAAKAAPAKAPPSKAAKAGKGGASAEMLSFLPRPALEDPPIGALDLQVWRAGPVPIPKRDATPLPSGDFVIEGYTVSFGEDDGEVIIQDAKGKRLKSVPPKLRKTDDYQSLMRGRKDDRARGRRARRVLEDRMISGSPISAAEVAWLVEDAAFAELLQGLVLVPRGGANGKQAAAQSGVLASWDASRGLGFLPLDYDARWTGWLDVEIAHPMKLGDVTPWQDLLVDLGMQQGLVQVFREVKGVPLAQKNLTASSLLSNRETRSASAIERVLIESGWIARRGRARRTLSLRTDAGIVGVEAWFDYGEYYMPSDSTTTGDFGFASIPGNKPLKFSMVPEVLVSEAIRSLEVALAQAGATKDEDDSEDGEGEDGEGEDGEGGDSDDD